MFKKGFLFINSSKYNTIFILFSLGSFNYKEFTIVQKSCFNLYTESYISCGRKGFKGNKKQTPFAKITLIEILIKIIIDKNILITFIIFKGVCFFKSIILSYLYKSLITNMKCYNIIDITSSPHNGCRLPNKINK